jgi:hypothetical protein
VPAPRRRTTVQWREGPRCCHVWPSLSAARRVPPPAHRAELRRRAADAVRAHGHAPRAAGPPRRRATPHATASDGQPCQRRRRAFRRQRATPNCRAWPRAQSRFRRRAARRCNRGGGNGRRTTATPWSSLRAGVDRVAFCRASNVANGGTSSTSCTARQFCVHRFGGWAPSEVIENRFCPMWQQDCFSLGIPGD